MLDYDENVFTPFEYHPARESQVSELLEATRCEFRCLGLPVSVPREVLNVFFEVNSVQEYVSYLVEVG